jgi:hypothetical protein
MKGPPMERLRIPIGGGNVEVPIARNVPILSISRIQGSGDGFSSDGGSVSRRRGEVVLCVRVGACRILLYVQSVECSWGV